MRGLPIRPVAVVAFAMVLAACDTIPADQVQFYADSYAQANEAGNRLYDALVEPIERSKVVPSAPEEAGEQREFPESFAPGDFLADEGDGPIRPGEPDEIAIRRVAMTTIADYNAIMVRLASGQTAAELSQEIDSLAGHLSILPGLGTAEVPLIAGAIGKLAGFAESLRADSELRAALIAGQEPIAELVDALRADTVDMYGTFLSFHDSALLRQERGINRISNTIEAFVSSFRAPGGELADSLDDQRQRFAAARARLPGFDVKALPTSTDGQVYDQDANDSLVLMIDRLEGAVAAHRAKVGEINSYYEALGAYARLLDQVKRANVGLVDAAQRRTLTLDPLKVITTAAAIRQDAEAILAGP